MVLIPLVPVLNLLYFYISTFRSMCAVPNMAVFCISLTSCFPGMLLTYFLNDFEIVPVVVYSVPKTSLNLLKYSFFSFSFSLLCCMSKLSSMPKYLHAFVGSSSLMSF